MDTHNTNTGTYDFSKPDLSTINSITTGNKLAEGVDKFHKMLTTPRKRTVSATTPHPIVFDVKTGKQIVTYGQYELWEKRLQKIWEVRYMTDVDVDYPEGDRALFTVEVDLEDFAKWACVKPYDAMNLIEFNHRSFEEYIISIESKWTPQND